MDRGDLDGPVPGLKVLGIVGPVGRRDVRGADQRRPDVVSAKPAWRSAGCKAPTHCGEQKVQVIARPGHGATICQADCRVCTVPHWIVCAGAQ